MYLLESTSVNDGLVLVSFEVSTKENVVSDSGVLDPCLLQGGRVGGGGGGGG